MNNELKNSFICLISNDLFWIKDTGPSLQFSRYSKEQSQWSYIRRSKIISITKEKRNSVQLHQQHSSLYITFFHKNERNIFFNTIINTYSALTPTLSHELFLMNKPLQLFVKAKFISSFKKRLIYYTIDILQLVHSNGDYPHFYFYQHTLRHRIWNLLYYTIKQPSIHIDSHVANEHKNTIQWNQNLKINSETKIRVFKGNNLNKNEFLIFDNWKFPKRSSINVTSEITFTFDILQVNFFCRKNTNTWKISTQSNCFVISSSSNNSAKTFYIDFIEKIESSKTNQTELTVYFNSSSSSPSLTWTFIDWMDKFLFRSLLYNVILNRNPRFKARQIIDLNINIITWNLANIAFPNVMLSCFMEEEWVNVDLIVIGVQECGVFKKSEWEKRWSTVLNNYGFQPIAGVVMWQMFEIAFIKKDLFPWVDNVFCSNKALGFGNVIGNKGGMWISFSFCNYNFVFANCHLAPKPYKVLERNEMAKNIIKLIKVVSAPYLEFDIYADYMFWWGDMNYRIDLPFQETIDVWKNNKNPISVLMTKDQLLKEKNKNNIFTWYTEPDILFFPTYRRTKKSKSTEDINKLDTISRHQTYTGDNLRNSLPFPKHTTEQSKYDDDNNNNNNNLDNSIFSIKSFQDNYKPNRRNTIDKLKEIQEYNNKENQSPSWCDRIWWKTNHKIKCKFYHSLGDIRQSDHWPVEAKYSISLLSPFFENQSSDPKDYSNSYFEFTKVSLNYNFNILFVDELKIELKTPYKVELKIVFPLIRDNVTSISNKINSINDKIYFPEFSVLFFHRLLFNYTQGRIWNMYFILTWIEVTSGKRHEMGYTKYNLWDVEEENKNILNHSMKWNISLHTRLVGKLAFQSDFKIDES